jgi:hypothetical protein
VYARVAARQKLIGSRLQEAVEERAMWRMTRLHDTSALEPATLSPHGWPIVHRSRQTARDARDMLARQSERLEIPAENVLTPDHLRRLCWNPTDPSRPSAIDAQLEELGARRWQRDIAVPLLVEAFSQAASIDQAEASALA